MKKSHKRILLCAAAVLLLAAAAALVWRYAPQLAWLAGEEGRRELEAFLSGFGPASAVVLFLLQIAQAFVAVIPAEPLEIFAGMTYGAWTGSLLCAAGVFCGSAAVFVLVRHFGRRVVDFFCRQEENSRWLRYFTQGSRLEATVFLLYLIPALPKDVFTYLAALTPIGRTRFLFLSTLARMPSILMSTFTGAALVEGAYLSAAVVAGLSAALGVAGFFLRERILAWLDCHTRHKLEL